MRKRILLLCISLLSISGIAGCGKNDNYIDEPSVLIQKIQEKNQTETVAVIEDAEGNENKVYGKLQSANYESAMEDNYDENSLIYDPETDEEQIKIIAEVLSVLFEEYENLQCSDDITTVWSAIDYYSYTWRWKKVNWEDNSTPDKYGYEESNDSEWYSGWYCVRYSSKLIKYFAETLYAGLETIPELPNNEDGNVRYDANTDEYVIRYGDGGAYNIVITSINENNGKLTVGFELWAGDEEKRKAADSVMVLVKNSDEEACAAGFKFSVESFKQYNR